MNLVAALDPMAISGIFAALCGAGYLLWPRRKKKTGTKAVASASRVEKNVAQLAQMETLEFEDRITKAVARGLYCLAFDIDKFGNSKHPEVVEAVAHDRKEIFRDGQFFPRQPLILPRLMSAIRNKDTDAQELVQIVRQDPGLTAEVLRVANSPLYRVTLQPVDRVEYALVLLGMDGLKTLACSAALRPIFQFKGTRFVGFAKIIWDQALDSAIAAQSYAKEGNPAICFSANMLTLVSCIAQIVLFRFTSCIYERFPDLEPSADAYVRIIEQHANNVSMQIMKDWQLGDELMLGLTGYFNQEPVNKCSLLSRSLYYGRLVGRLSILLKHNKITINQSRAILKYKGLQAAMIDHLLEPVLQELKTSLNRQIDMALEESRIDAGSANG